MRHSAAGEHSTNKQRIPVMLLVQLGITAACITVAAIVFRQSFFRVFPTYVSLVIGLLLALVNRYANLVGGCNAILHGIVAMYYNANRLYLRLVYRHSLHRRKYNSVR